MANPATLRQSSEPGRSSFRKRHPLLFWITVSFGLILVVLIVACEIVLHRAEPILRARVVQTLSARFNSRVELKSLDVSLFRGIEVSGKDLAIYPYNLQTSHPEFSVDRFSFRTPLIDLLRSPMKIGHVDIQGLNIHLPSKSERREMLPGTNSTGGNSKNIRIIVGEIHSTDALLTRDTDQPGKVPLQFQIRNVLLKSVAAGRPLNFTAMLANPKPVGNIRSSGTFGPWNADDPGQTAVAGNYSFRDANLGTLKGIGGILSSTGHYEGVLQKIVVDGQTDTPDFEIDISGHKVPLHTDFHAIVDGTNGDTYLQPVVGHFLHSALTAVGRVVRTPGIPGHHIYLDVSMSQAYIQDLLQLAVRTDPPLMTGRVRMHTKLEIPPGKEDVAQKLKLNGNFDIVNAYFTNQKVQSKVDELSLRSQGKVNLAHEESKNPQTANIGSEMRGNFILDNGKLSISNLNYDVLGAKIKLQGVYTLDGNTFDFFGTASLKASLSRIVGGWKGALLTPLDPIFRKNGSGTQVPIKITGTRSEPHFGLDMFHPDALEKKRGERPK